MTTTELLSARTDKAVQSLLKHGHLGKNSEALRVVPTELQGGTA